MINLLPPSAKKRLKREHRLRFLSMLMIAAAIACLVALLFSIPTFILQKYQLNSIREDEAFTAEVEAEQKRIARENLELQRILDHIGRQTPPPSRSDVIARVDDLAGGEVRVDRFAFDAKDKLTISGVAATRPALSAFRDRLNAERSFSSVELPLASLVSERDAEFTITLVIK